MSHEPITPTLHVFDILEATPCVVEIHRINGSLAFGWCEVCADEHIIDHLGFIKGNGPWKRADTTCTGITAAWCPLHGDCACSDRDDGTPTLLCTYCLARKPWDSRHFPTPYAKCRACIEAQTSGSGGGQ